MSKTVYQTDHAGLFLCAVKADESPLEPGVYLLPAGAVETPPPEDWPEDKWPRWTGASWALVNRPRQPEQHSPAAKLASFLANNPDVAALIEEQQQ
ncbi:phage tail protein [Halopseudomonas oceani]|uniref:phage tail protein n=1 Tax=Halopseudomonas oceani TaxID=1708783 RepID=UPI002AA712B8|nr:phage tail protein [Halopseudomonas oceani]